AVVPGLVRAVAGGRVEHVDDGARAVRRDDRAAVVRDRGDRLARGRPELLLPALRRIRQRFAADRLVRRRGPQEVAARRVDVHGELDVRVLLLERDLVLVLRLGQLARAGVRVARAARGRAFVAVEERPDGEAAVVVDAPGVARCGVERRRAD